MPPPGPLQGPRTWAIHIIFSVHNVLAFSLVNPTSCILNTVFTFQRSSPYKSLAPFKFEQLFRVPIKYEVDIDECFACVVTLYNYSNFIKLRQPKVCDPEYVIYCLYLHKNCAEYTVQFQLDRVFGPKL